MTSMRKILWAACIVQALSYVSSNTSRVRRDAPGYRNDAPEGQARALCSDERCELAVAVAYSIRKLSSFVAQQAADANDDLFFTLRMAQGQLYQLRRDAPHIYADEEVGGLLTAAEADLETAALVLQENFKFSEHLGEEFNILMAPERGRTMQRIDSNFAIPNFELLWNGAFLENLASAGGIMQFNAASSDRCLAQLMPRNLTSFQAEIFGRTSYCPVDDPCWLMMTKPGAPGYYLTHQLMFLALGGTTGCSPDFEAHARNYFGSRLSAYVGPVTPEIMRYQCRSVFLEALMYVVSGIPDAEKDLFLEQGFLCGATVYMPQFFQASWVRTVLSWQKPSGCFGFFDNIQYRPSNARADIVGPGAVEKRSISDNSLGTAGATGQSEAENTGPSARREKAMTGGCFSHNTGVALGYLSVAIRYLTD